MDCRHATAGRLLQKAVGADWRMVYKRQGRGEGCQVTAECWMETERLSQDTDTAEETDMQQLIIQAGSKYNLQKNLNCKNIRLGHQSN